MGEDGRPVDELAERAESYLHGRSLTPKEYEALKQSIATFDPIFVSDRTYFVLGSYGRPEIRRLRLVSAEFDSRPDAFAFLMIDVPGEWTNTYLKFRILADYADVIVGVAEHAYGGFLVEQGYFTALESYFAKTHVLKREYEDVDVAELRTRVNAENPYSAMQIPIFGMLDERGRLCRWTTEAEPLACAEGIP